MTLAADPMFKGPTGSTRMILMRSSVIDNYLNDLNAMRKTILAILNKIKLGLATKSSSAEMLKHKEKYKKRENKGFMIWRICTAISRT
jgi:hypothetical protein